MAAEQIARAITITATGVEAMKKGGRPRRQDVERGLGGRIKASVYRTLRESAKESHDKDRVELDSWQKMRAMFQNRLLDPRLASRLGRMFLMGNPVRIDEPMLLAGLRLAQILFVYDVRILKLYRGVRAQDIARQKGLTLAEEDPRSIEQARGAYSAVVAILGSHELSIPEYGGTEIILRSPGRLARATFAICRDDGDGAHRTAHELNDGIRGLKQLAEGWGLYDDAPARMRRWRDDDTIAARAARILTPPDEEADR